VSGPVITYANETVNKVDTAKTGRYILTYKATDELGASKTGSFTVTVK
jgi:hypothetical protein